MIKIYLIHREKNHEIIPRLVNFLLRLVMDSSANVVKRSLRASGKILRATLKWVATAPVIIPEMENTWAQISKLKVEIINMIDSDNDG